MATVSQHEGDSDADMDTVLSILDTRTSAEFNGRLSVLTPTCIYHDERTNPRGYHKLLTNLPRPVFQAAP